MQCMGCTETFPRKYIYICQGCRARYCKECIRDHLPCNPVKQEEPPVKEEVVQEPEPSPVNPERKTAPFNLERFRTFQKYAGCVTTQELATGLWKEVMFYFTQAERDEILDVWGIVADDNTKARKLSVLSLTDVCPLDKVCDRIVGRYVRSQDFIG